MLSRFFQRIRFEPTELEIDRGAKRSGRGKDGHRPAGAPGLEDGGLVYDHRTVVFE